ncbi:MAG: outer membrane protein assembly factor BamA [Kiritimatiellae bacterium]|nr:outer membrane protein assembly factor BamA [Kiritimatiellia bacterium]
MILRAQNREAMLVAMLLAGLCATAYPVTIREIRIETPGGAVDEGFVRERLQVRVGTELDRLRLMQDVRELERTGRFSDVQVSAERADTQVDLVFTIVPKPRIAEIVIEGADALGGRKVRDLLAVHVGEAVDEAALAAGARRVQEEYRKKYRPDTRLVWALEPLDAPGAVRVRIQVKETPRELIRDFQFHGVRAFPEYELRKTMLQRAYRWFNPTHWFSSAGRMDEDLLAEDTHRLRRYYADRGYLDARISSPRIEPVRPGRVAVHFDVEEGPTYAIGSMAISGASSVDTNELFRMIRLREGDIASRQAIETAADAIMDYYGNRGYIRTEVDPRVEPAAEEARVAVVFMVREGRISTIRDIRFQGQAITRDLVMRREVTMEPGEKFNRSRVHNSERRLRNLGYFSSVYSYPEATPEAGFDDLVFQVEETRMGQASIGAAFSSIDSFTTFFELSHGNMDLSRWPPLGAGQKLRLRGTLGDERTDAEIEFIEPYFLDRRQALGLTLFHREIRYESRVFDMQRTGGELSLSRPIWPYVRGRLAYGLERINLFDMEDDASETIRAEEGARLKSSVTLSFTRETRDQLWAPTRGHNLRALFGVAGGPLMGDTDWTKVEASASQYLPVMSTNNVVLLRARAGAIREFGDSDRVPLFDRYFLGGPMNVRAFKYREVGPVDETEEPIGGRSMAFASAEYLRRLHEMLRVSVYWDGGMVESADYSWNGTWNSGVGLGCYVDIAMLPLRFFYAWPLETEPHNDRSSGVFSFMIGHSF